MTVEFDVVAKGCSGPAAALEAEDFRSQVKPVWCPGCGDYSVLAALTEALADLGRPPETVALVSGIGCSSRIPAYTSVYGIHGVHGRALPTATGLKLARPDLTVLAAGGDGDGFSIGGNHFLHACRRNVDLTYIVMDNEVYGMTKGQASPTTAADWTGGGLTPDGTGLAPIQPLVIALAAGANYVARCFSGDLGGLTAVLVEAIRHPGFSVVQILSPCATFRPEQRQWKNQVRPFPEDGPVDDRAAALGLLMRDDGLSVGRALFKGDRPPYQPEPGAAGSPDVLEEDFAL
jgi:2-oxoglutarate ferredoxin oxidoreductase subunit beta